MTGSAPTNEADPPVSESVAGRGGAARPVRIVRRYVDGPSGQIHVAETGRGPDVLLLHQTPRSCDEFGEVMTILADRLHLLAIDLPGMGASDQHPAGPSIENYAAAAASVIEQAANGPATVCGHHTGGVVAIALAAHQPHLVKSLILSSTPWIDEEERARRARKQPIDSMEPQPDGSHLLALWEQRAPFYGGRTDHLARFVRDALRAADPTDGHRAVGCYRMEEAAPLIGCPVTIVEHSADPFARVHTATLAERLPGARVEVITEGRVPLEATAADVAAVLLAAVERDERTPAPSFDDPSASCQHVKNY